MEFSQAYRKLEQEFEEQVASDNLDPDWDSIFLPNVEPTGPVDFILIGTEPSRGSWASNREKAAQSIAGGFRNFAGCLRCDAVHYAIDQYLCEGSGSYYLTDLAKGAMFITSPGAKRSAKYNRWYPLLVKELALVAMPGAKIIAFGNVPYHFLRKAEQPGLVGSVTHYSRQAAAHWGRSALLHPAEFENFRTGVEFLPNGTPISESRKELMFHYKLSFERLRVEEGGLDWSELRRCHWGEVTGGEQPRQIKGCDCEGG